MRWTLVIALAFVLTGIAMAQTKITFDEANALPKGWESGITGKGAAKWEVVWTKADSVTLLEDFTFGNR